MRNRPASAIYSAPVIITAAPVGKKSNIRKPRKPASSSAIEQRRLGGVPIKVINPPSKEPNERGMSSLVTG